MQPLTGPQREALTWADAAPLVRWSDGLWRGMGCSLSDDDHDNDDVRLLAKMGLLEMMPIGAVITEAGRRALAD